MDHGSSANLWLGNIISAGAILSTILGWAPAIAAVVALVWYVIQISESETVRRWRAARLHRRIVRLKATLLSLQARVRQDQEDA